MTAGPKTCPKCRLVNDSTATVCDCGYDFSSGAVRARSAQAAPKRSKKDLDVIIDGAEAFRGLLVLVLVQLVLGLFSRVAHRMGDDQPVLALVALAASLSVLVVAVMAARKASALARAMGVENPAVAGAVVLVTGILGYLWLSSKARAWCSHEGIEVGILGPTTDAMERLYRRLQEARTTDGAA